MTREQAEDSTQLRAVVGSTLHGLAIEGTDDRDEMGVCLENLRFAAGLQSFEQFIYRSAAEREGKHDAPSRAGDLDLTLYSLRKYVRLALNGNPTIMLLLFVPPELCIKRTAIGARLQELVPAFVSRRAGGAFLGYLTAQRQRLLGERGGKDVRRPALEAAHGYDTKYAMHMLRLGVQGVELLRTGRITLPIPEPERGYLRDVRQGRVQLQDVITRTGELERELKDLRDTSPWPEVPDAKAADAFLVSTYGAWWSTEWNELFRVPERRRSVVQPCE
jgi:hypothetical protein